MVGVESENFPSEISPRNIQQVLDWETRTTDSVCRPRLPTGVSSSQDDRHCLSYKTVVVVGRRKTWEFLFPKESGRCLGQGG